MPRVKCRITIDAPPRRVWDIISDISSHPEWMADATAIRFTTRTRTGKGTEFDCDTNIGPFKVVDHMVVTAWDPPSAMGVAHTGVVAGAGRFTLRRTRRGRTRFTWIEKLSFPWWLGGPIGAVAAKPVLGRVWNANLRRLKHLVEHGQLAESQR